MMAAFRRRGSSSTDTSTMSLDDDDTVVIPSTHLLSCGRWRRSRHRVVVVAVAQLQQQVQARQQQQQLQQPLRQQTTATLQLVPMPAKYVRVCAATHHTAYDHVPAATIALVSNGRSADTHPVTALFFRWATTKYRMARHLLLLKLRSRHSLQLPMWVQSLALRPRGNECAVMSVALNGKKVQAYCFQVGDSSGRYVGCMTVVPSFTLHRVLGWSY
jgi:hypothetical protein